MCIRTVHIRFGRWPVMFHCLTQKLQTWTLQDKTDLSKGGRLAIFKEEFWALCLCLWQDCAQTHAACGVSEHAVWTVTQEIHFTRVRPVKTNWKCSCLAPGRSETMSSIYCLWLDVCEVQKEFQFCGAFACGRQLFTSSHSPVRRYTATYWGYLLKRIATSRYWLYVTLCMETDTMSDLSQWSIQCFLCGSISDCSTKPHHFFVAELELSSRRVAIQLL